MTEPDAAPRPSSLVSRALLAANIVAALMFAAVFLIFCLKIGMRYIAHNELAWPDEVSIILFIWIIFWANAFILSDRDHIRFDLLVLAMPPGGRRIMAMLRALLIGGIFAAATPASIGYIRFLWREHTPVLGLPLSWVYACFGLFMVTVPLRAAWSLARLCGRRWRAEL
jgi:TRAP-type C4-dicarboxylate transport system permease small subunit